MKCQICGNKKLELVLSLGHQPVVQAYLRTEDLTKPETTYPLNFSRCPKCGLLQLDSIVDPKIVFPKNYPYRTGLTNMLIRNFEELAEESLKENRFKKGDLVIDIGSNDGTLLQSFKKRGARVLGIEPTDAAKVANKNGIATLQEYFTKDSVKQILNKYGKAKIVTATNVFAHIPNPVPLTKNIKSILSPEGVFVSESQYLMDIVEKFEFDTIYHEHLRFYSLKPLSKLFALTGLNLVDAKRISAAGGSIRVYAARGGKLSAGAKQLIKEEEKAGLYSPARWKKFSADALFAKNDLLSLLIGLKKNGARIVGITSSARSNTLLGFTKIDRGILDYTGEKNGSPKIGMFTPGTHIPVVDESKIFKEQPEYALMLSWHIGEELAQIFQKNGYKGKFIIPLPKPRIV
ncbi:class I SAM-dependent methyltransferase [Candidatus Giovannonibacteria bacterium]|nr:class I SAM-dependent methyltransferase [Candidatus Giovannonibacteria bacterium]